MPPVNYHNGKFPPDGKDFNLQEIICYLTPAGMNLARYDGLLQTFPNANVLLSPLSRNEAVLSSRIEGTRATLSEVLDYEAGEIPEDENTRNDVKEIINYRYAMIEAQKNIEDGLPFCQRLLKGAHKILLSDVRGEDKAPGEYRRGQVFIGNFDDTVDMAKFVPLEADKIPDAMSCWEKFANNISATDMFLQLACMHVEFESIHPFNDGNGRIGRMLIPLFLYYRKVISAPTFYISAYFEKHRDEYYERLRNVSRNNDWTGWCVFFLKAVAEQANENYEKARKIQQLYEEQINNVTEITHSHLNVDVVKFIFSKPIFNSSEILKTINAPDTTIRGIVRPLVKKGVLKVVRPGRGRRPALYIFPELLNIID